MILRNLSKALKEQNWTAILIEFFLLVAGVFLGIQAANWNEQQRARKSGQLIGPGGVGATAQARLEAMSLFSELGADSVIPIRMDPAFIALTR